MRYHDLVVSRDGSRLYAAAGDSLQLISLPEGKVIATYVCEKQTDKKSNQTPAPTHFHTLTVSRDNKYVIAVTNESKAVHVFNSNDLSLISRRPFPKRPSAIDSTKDALVVGDKFGDVYAVPITSMDSVIKEEGDASIEPILGHVSMLVDVKMGEFNGREYVITSDRDEHIRVTRYPQSYVIERWLFGHEEFVSSVEVLPWGDKNLLVSGGGDDYVFLWDWTTGELKDKFDLRSVIGEHLDDSHEPPKKKGGAQEDRYEITVSRVVSIPDLHQVVVLCEGTNALIQFKITDKLEFVSKLVLDHKIIGVTASRDSSLVVSLDPVQGDSDLLLRLAANDTGLQIESSINVDTSTIKGEQAALYTIKQLRKRGEH